MKQVFYLFGQLSDTDVDWLANTGNKQVIPAGETLVQEGSEVGAVYIVLRGKFSVSTHARGEVSVLAWGEIAGEMSFVDGGPATASLIAMESSEVLKIGHRRLTQRIQREAGFSGRFYRATTLALADRLREQMHAKETETLEELSPELLDTVHTAGTRFDRLLKLLQPAHE
jgi:CRP/FNR family transcriptional regulator, cyclic AMP receptor protein